MLGRRPQDEDFTTRMDPAAPAGRTRARRGACPPGWSAEHRRREEQLTATSEVLEVIGRSASELEPVFETVVRHAVRLCRADSGLICQLDGDVYRIAYVARRPAESTASYLAGDPVAAGAGTLVGRVGLERRVGPDRRRRSRPAYRWHEAASSAATARCSASRCSPAIASSA